MGVDIGLLQPLWLLLLPLPWLWFYWQRQHPLPWPQILPVLTMRYPPIGELQSTEKTTTHSVKSLGAGVLIAMAMSLILLAISQPVVYKAPAVDESLSEPVELVLLVSTALSMSLSDYEVDGQAVSRMTLTKQLLDGLVVEYSGSRIGLVVLGNPPAVWLPLTSDKQLVRDAVSRINTFLGGRLTDMGASLTLVRDYFQEDREKVVLLISDGSAQVGSESPQQAARQLSEAGMTVYVIAMGSTDPLAGSPDKSSLIYEPVNLTMLRQVAEQGNGQLFHARHAQAFHDALKTIESKHRQLIKKQDKQTLTEALYPLPLALAMLILLFIVLKQPDSHFSGEASETPPGGKG